MSRYRYTPKRRAALRKAQLASARKRRRGGSKVKKALKYTAIGVGVAAAGVYATNKTVRYHGVYFDGGKNRNTNLRGFHTSTARISNRSGSPKLRTGVLATKHLYAVAFHIPKGYRSSFLR